MVMVLMMALFRQLLKLQKVKVLQSLQMERSLKTGMILIPGTQKQTEKVKILLQALLLQLKVI